MTQPHLPDYPVVTLAPGDLVMCKTPHILVTVLGSCVSVTMLHRASGLAGMCHAMLPEQRLGGPTEVRGVYRFLDRALDHMVGWFTARGVDLQALELKVFGGADVLSAAMPPRPGVLTVGAQNVLALTRLLEGHGLTTLRSALGGRAGLKLFFDTASGEVLVRRLAPMGQNVIPLLEEHHGTQDQGPGRGRLGARARDAARDPG